MRGGGILKNMFFSAWLAGIAYFVFGAIVGSFLNVVALRYNTGRTLGGRSSCFSCGRSLTALDLVPLFSFLALAGKCRSCGSKISWQYPLVEAGTALLFLGVYLTGFALAYQIYLLPLLSLLAVILIYDLRHKIIPDALVYLFGALSLVSLFIDFPAQSLAYPTLQALMAGPLLAFPFAFLWLVSRGRWIGLGDAKLALGMGWLLGLAKGATAVLFAVWIGAAVSIALLLAQKWLFRGTNRLTMKSEIPFAPFLILGLLIVLFFNSNFFQPSLF